jgi:hypothetical protein
MQKGSDLFTQVEVSADEGAGWSSGVSQTEAESARGEVVAVLDRDRKKYVVGMREDVTPAVRGCRKRNLRNGHKWETTICKVAALLAGSKRTRLAGTIALNQIGKV